MAKPPRNAPCPCGSGKKYKHCCLLGKEARGGEAKSAKPSSGVWTESGPWEGWELVEDELDTLSNRIVGLLEQGRLGEARAVCEELRQRHPQEYDWMERMGQIEEASGHYAAAGRHYREAFTFLAGKPGYDPQIRQWLEQRALLMEARASGAGPKNSEA